MVKVIMLPLNSGEPAGAMCFVQKEDGSIARPNDGVCNSEERAAVWQENGWMDSENLTIFEKDPDYMWYWITLFEYLAKMRLGSEDPLSQ